MAEFQLNVRYCRTWNFWTFSIFWFSAVGTVANWLGGGTFLTVCCMTSKTANRGIKYVADTEPHDVNSMVLVSPDNETQSEEEVTD
jgi:hypothetical protein